MKIFALSMMLISLSSHAGIPEVCHQFAKNPSGFKVNEKPKDCSYELSEGTCRTESLTCAGSYLNSKSDGAYLGFDQVAVDYKGKMYNFLSRRHQDLSQVLIIGEISEKGTTILCDIKNKVTEVKLLNPEKEICKAIYEGKVIKIGLLDEKVEKDLQRNHSKIKYSKDGYESGAGCGCDLEEYKASSSDPKNDESFVNAFNKLNSNEPSCSGESLPLKWSVVRFDKKDYLYLENPDIKQGALSHGYKKLQPEGLYSWNGSGFEKVCGKTYETKRVAVDPELN